MLGDFGSFFNFLIFTLTCVLWNWSMHIVSSDINECNGLCLLATQLIDLWFMVLMIYGHFLLCQSSSLYRHIKSKKSNIFEHIFHSVDYPYQIAYLSKSNWSQTVLVLCVSRITKSCPPLSNIHMNMHKLHLGWILSIFKIPLLKKITTHTTTYNKNVFWNLLIWFWMWIRTRIGFVLKCNKRIVF